LTNNNHLDVQPAAAPLPTTPIAEPSYAIAAYDFEALEEGELSVKEGDQVLVLDPVPDEEWWQCLLIDENGVEKQGVIPASYLQVSIAQNNCLSM
jgi:hypothetical protein